MNKEKLTNSDILRESATSARSILYLLFLMFFDEANDFPDNVLASCVGRSTVRFSTRTAPVLLATLGRLALWFLRPVFLLGCFKAVRSTAFFLVAGTDTNVFEERA